MGAGRGTGQLPPQSFLYGGSELLLYPLFLQFFTLLASIWEEQIMHFLKAPYIAPI